MGRQSGVTESQLAALPDFEDAAEFSGTEKLVLRYAVAMTNTPVNISEDMFPESQKAFDTLVTLPLFNSMTDGMQTYVIEAIKRLLA